KRPSSRPRANQHDSWGRLTNTSGWESMATVSSASNLRRAQMAAAITPRVAHCRRVLQVITPSHMSGAEMQLVRLTRKLRARGHEMPVLVKHDSPAIEHMLEQGMSVDRARIGGKVNFMAISRIARAARQHHVDLVQSTLS